LIEFGCAACAYSLICNMMMWHVGIGMVKFGFYTTSLLNLKWIFY